MILAVDIGNSSVTFGVFDATELTETFAFPTSEIIFGVNAEELQQKLITLQQIKNVVIASVVPDATDNLRLVIATSIISATITVIHNNDVPIINRYRHPEQVGTDRLLSALAGYHLYAKSKNKSLIVIDLGTATTFNCVNTSGEYLGGIISLGVESSARHLSSIAAQLPNITLEFPPHVLGTNTIESMQSGILYGALASIEGLVVRLREEVFAAQEIIVVSTGGLSRLFSGKTSIINYVDPSLVLRGILITALSL